MTTVAPESAPETPVIAPDLAGVTHLVGVGEIAEKYRVAKSNVSSWAARRDVNGFPLPVVKLAAGPLYDGRQVQSWYAGKYAVQSWANAVQS